MGWEVPWVRTFWENQIEQDITENKIPAPPPHPPAVLTELTYDIIQQASFWEYIWRKWNQDLEEIPAVQCSLYLIHNSQDTETTNLSDHHQMNG